MVRVTLFYPNDAAIEVYTEGINAACGVVLDAINEGIEAVQFELDVVLPEDAVQVDVEAKIP